MNTTEILPRLEGLMRAMSDKGLRSPAASLTVYSHDSITVFIHDAEDTINGHHGGRTVPEAFGKAEAFVAALPSPDEIHRRKFLSLAGAAADYAAEHLPGDEIATEVRATIVAGMQRISENILTDQRAM